MSGGAATITQARLGHRQLYHHALAEMFSLLAEIPAEGYYGSSSAGYFDGEGSGHDFYGTLYMPPTGFVNNCDGGRSTQYCDYKPQ